ncbi:succinate dehydrogenase assembly factor 4 [Algiphilus sp.]|uniref:DUF1674 domain-containing protein n=1 Tax=Algiphilus sp. TaxID=1872431 RepID=UPI001CA5FCBD|nr:succinate dehydrogenase assembly factor 4 [Algiphilus sp.]MBY8966882.1 DUF1674 domain-containing protein [Algiphilus acroporae]MCI5061749.1 DUF1674 domain-containing protein [Algiphilus sp.]MCI5103049.1 DUF1674 domain-containing protein [Algiphilus sp.]MCR9092159.1 DUF1674 domain-containing protein [Pseudomonadota bacterium]
MTEHSKDRESAPTPHSEALPQATHSGGSEGQPTPAAESGDNTRPTEIGGRRGPEPTRYGDWEKKGRCIDF